MKLCSKLFHIPAVALAAALLQPALALAQLAPAPATTPPAVALPATPPAQEVPTAKAQIMPTPADAAPAPIVRPALAEPNAVAVQPSAIALSFPKIPSGLDSHRKAES